MHNEWNKLLGLTNYEFQKEFDSEKELKKEIKQYFKAIDQVYEADFMDDYIKMRCYQYCSDKILYLLDERVDVFILSADVYSRKPDTYDIPTRELNIITREEVEDYCDSPLTVLNPNET